jgi:hypothetical protein
MRKAITILSLFTIFFSFSCKKYPDGPAISFHSKSARVINNWTCEKALVNNSESTPFYSKYNYSYGSDHSYAENNGYNILNGSWELVSDDDSLVVRLSSNQVLHRFKILRLKNNSLWLTEKVNTSTYEWHMKSK